MSSFYTIEGEFSYSVTIEKSKFLCYIKGIENEDEAKEFIMQIKKMNSLATHNCYAYIADQNGLVMKFSDDGEPQGTAGLPMLEVLKNKKIYKAVAVVTRYYGGIKLGTGGLTRAYSGAVSGCLATSRIVEMEDGIEFLITCDYENYSSLLRFLNVPDIKVLSTDFNDSVLIKFVCKIKYVNNIKNQLFDLFKGKPQLAEGKKGFYSFGELCQK